MSYKKFSEDDTISFAKVSGDYNPIHVNPNEARRLLYGTQVIHGMHYALWALEILFKDNFKNYKFYIDNIDINFLKPVRINQKIKIKFLENNKKENISIVIVCEKTSTVLTQINLKILKLTNEKYYFKPEQKKYLSAHIEENLLNDLDGHKGYDKLSFDMMLAKSMWPNLMNTIPHHQIATLVCTTRIVGTKCPGLYSIFWKLSLQYTANHDKENLEYNVSKVDKRFNLAYINIEAPGMKGEIKAFVRPPPVKQDSYVFFKNKIIKNEFKNQNALILGGSRGLGEVVIKTLSAGSANVKMTYFKGLNESKLISEDIKASGDPKIDYFKFDITTDSISSLIDNLDNWKPTHVYYFITPFIQIGTKNNFSLDLYQKFYEYYVSNFLNIVKIFSSLGVENFFYPSTFFINEKTKNKKAIEYTEAKHCGEIMCKSIEKHSRLKIYTPRLPKMKTDQTNFLNQESGICANDIIIGELRRFKEYTK